MDRRDFLKESMAAGFLMASDITTPALADSPQRSTGHGTPPSVGYKFDAAGNALPLLGNTIVCTVPRTSILNGALTHFQEMMKTSRAHDSFAFLPPSSFHMTMFEGVTDLNRRPGYWPADLSGEATLTACNRHFLDKLKTFDLGCDPLFRMRLAEDQQGLHASSAVTINLVPVDEAETVKLRRARDRLSDLLELRKDDHETYQFHTTQAYVIKWVDDDLQIAHRRILSAALEDLRRRVEILEFPAPAFCFFDDMSEFRPRLFLRGQI